MKTFVSTPPLSEAALAAMLEHASLRLRLGRALRVALAALGVGLVLAGGLIAAQRLAGLDSRLIVPALTLPIICALFLGVIGWLRYRPQLDGVAMLLDRLAGTSEHIITWHQFRKLGSAAPVRPEILAAQRDATLQAAAGINPGKLLPLRLPDWSRALWLALILLCCALLVPPRRSASVSSKIRADAAAEIMLSQPGSGGSDTASSSPTARVQPLSPTELLQFQLLASDSEMTAAQRAAALRDLQQKIGAVPESELAPELRDLLAVLRQEPNGATVEAAGSQTVLKVNDGKTGGPLDNQALHGEARIPASPEKVFTSIAHTMPDVQEQLSRYYASLNQNPDRSQP